MDERKNNSKKPPKERRRHRYILTKSIDELTEVEWTMMLAYEEDDRQTDPLYRRCESIFSTYVEKRMDYPNILGVAGHGISPNKKIKVWDAYINIDSHYRCIGHYLTLSEAETASDTARLRLERILKNNLKKIIGSADGLDSHS
jgi:hypothetical protein